MNTNSLSSLSPSISRPTSRALVLGGGGSTGNAWLIGILAGLADGGLDVTSADLVVGTSAGSTAAAQLAGATPSELFAAIVGAVAQAPTTHIGLGSDRGGQPARPITDHLKRVTEIMASASDVSDMRRRMGTSALEMDAASDGSWRDQWRTTVASRLPSQHWPEGRTVITAVNAETGDPVVFDRYSGVELVDAVAASCAGGLPYRIGGIPYIDGGYRSNAENADLASGYSRVLVLSPFSGRSLMPQAWGTHLATQVGSLRAEGGAVEVISPRPDEEHMFGANAMNLSMRPAAAQAGHDQGQALAAALAEFWEAKPGEATQR